MPQLILWTALPNGIVTPADRPGRHLSLSVRVSPRLTPAGGAGTLVDFADFRTWAEKTWRFSIRIGDLPTITGVAPEGARDAALWRSLFLEPEPIAVEPRKTGDYTQSFIHSFPAAQILEFLRRTYRAAGLAHPETLPPIDWLLGNPRTAPNPDHFAGIDLSPDNRAGALAILQKYSEAHHVSPAYRQNHPAKADAIDFLQAELFHEFKGRTYGKEITPPKFDFHRAVAMLGNYDPLLRRLGLVFDLLVPLPAGLPENTPFPVRIQPELDLEDGDDARLAPATLCRLDTAAGCFEAVPGPQARIVNGHLDLANPDFTLCQVDVDGAALKLPNFAQNLRPRSHGSDRFGGETASGVPTLRTGGLSVLLNRRAADFFGRIQAGANFESILADLGKRPALANLNLPAPLTFQAEDIVRGFRVDIHDADGWRSLCRRQGTYRHGSGQQELPDIPPDEGTVTTAVTTAVPTGAPPPNPALFLHEALFHWDGWSLAAPLPGKAVVKPEPGKKTDIVAVTPPTSDNELGLNVTFKPVKGSLPPLRFGRRYRVRARTVDIAGNSRLLQDDSDLAGATPEVPYLRFEPVPAPAVNPIPVSRPGESAERLVIRSRPDDPAPITAETADRQIVAPLASVRLAELHGCLDRPVPDAGKTWYDILKERDGVPLKGIPCTEAPYLPDPLSRATAIAGLPGADAPVVFPVAFEGQWPHASTFRIVLEEGPLGYTWESGPRRFVVRLPKAARLTLRLSSQLPDAAALEQLGIWNWLCDKTPDAWVEKLRVLALQGRHWMLTPSREITLVHAVQQPLAAPAVDQPRPERTVGSTFTKVTGTLAVSAASTDKVDLRAEWKEYRNDSAHPDGFTVAERSGDVAKVQIDDPACDRVPLAIEHEFSDTKHRRVSYWATATSRFREYFEAAAPGTAATALDFTNPARSVDRTQPDFVLDIPSSARPEAPVVDFIVPTFGWTRQDEADATHSRRRGRGVRVYLQGDWFSSGEGELLGVVLAHGPQITPADGLTASERASLGRENAPVPPEGIRPLISRWGIDPIWVSAPAHELPTLDHFPDTVARQSGLVLAEDVAIPTGQPGWGVAVAGHAVRWDATLQRWYCDITLDAGPSYFPFVRLALARYQPCSVRGVELSRVVRNDCVQTVPDRLLSVANVGGDPARIRLTVSGVAPRSAKGVNCPNRLGARLEVRQDSAAESVWVPVIGSAIALAEMQLTKTAAVWSADLALPAPRASRRFRIVVEEYEILAADEGRGLSPAAFEGSAPEERHAAGLAAVRMMIIDTTPKAVWPRLVYADTVDL